MDMIERKKLYSVIIKGTIIKAGSRVNLSLRSCVPRPSDIFDSVLDGMTAVVESIEQDFENRVYLAVTLEDDPGRDLGIDGKPGHRFYFKPNEVDPL